MVYLLHTNKYTHVFVSSVFLCAFLSQPRHLQQLGSLTESRNLGVGSVIFALGSLSLNSNQGDSSPERHLEKLEPMEVQNRRLHVRVILDLLQVASILWDSVEFVVLWVHFDFPSLHCVPVYLVYIIYLYIYINYIESLYISLDICVLPICIHLLLHVFVHVLSIVSFSVANLRSHGFLSSFRNC